MALFGAAVPGAWELEDRDYGFLTDWLPKAEMSDLNLGTLPELELPPPPEAAPTIDLRWMRAVFVVLVVLAALAVVAALVRRFMRTTVRPEESRPVHMPGEASSGEMPEIPVLQRGVAQAQRMLEEGTEPADAIISAWLALEQAAAESGVRRMPAQTPTEFAVAVLDLTAADPDATRRLLQLYRRARFSRHPSTRQDVSEAVRCLALLAESWDAEPIDVIR